VGVYLILTGILVRFVIVFPTHVGVYLARLQTMADGSPVFPTHVGVYPIPAGI